MRILKLSENISLRSDEGKHLLFDNISGNIFKLNELSYEILSLCNGKNSEEDIIGKITDIFDVSRETITKDFDDMIGVLLDKGYVASVQK